MTARDIQRHIKSKNFLPVYLLYGEEDFLIERTARQLAEAALGDGDASFNFHTFRGTEDKVEAVTAAANEFPFMADRRVVLLKEADKLFTQLALSSYALKPSPETVLILMAGSLKTKRRPPARKPGNRKAGNRKPGNRTTRSDVLSDIRTAEKQGLAATVEFKKLGDRAVLQWIEDEFHAVGKSITSEAVAVFHGLKGNYTRELSSEIEKILSALHDRSEVTSDDVYLYLGSSRQFNVFELSDTIMSRNFSAAQEIAQKVLAADGAVLIINTMIRQFSLLWRIKHHHLGSGRVSDADARAVGLGMAWQFEALRKFLPNFTDPLYFERCFENLLQADRAVKTSGDNPATVITTLMYRLINE